MGDNIQSSKTPAEWLALAEQGKTNWPELLQKPSDKKDA